MTELSWTWVKVREPFASSKHDPFVYRSKETSPLDNFQKHFGNIRSRLAEPATPVTFFRVCKALAMMWEEDARRVNEEVVPYLDGHRKHWPEEMRSHPAFWERLWLGEHATRFGPLRLVTRLDLSHRRLGNLVIERIAKAQDLIDMTHLDLRGNDIEDTSLDAWADAEHLESLTCIDLGDNPLDNPSALLDLENLTTIKLIHAGVQDTFLRALAAHPEPRVESLWLTRTCISASGMRALYEAENLHHLRMLEITGVPTDSDLERALMDRWPELDIVRGR